VTRLGCKHGGGPTLTGGIGCSLGAWGWADKPSDRFNFSCITASNSVFYSKDGLCGSSHLMKTLPQSELLDTGIGPHSSLPSFVDRNIDGTLCISFEFINIFPICLRGYSNSRIIGFTMNPNRKWIRFAKRIWTVIHCESWSWSDNRIAPETYWRFLFDMFASKLVSFLTWKSCFGVDLHC